MGIQKEEEIKLMERLTQVNKEIDINFQSYKKYLQLKKERKDLVYKLTKLFRHK